MDANDPFFALLKHIGPVLPVLIWALARGATESQPPATPRDRMTDTRDIARSVSSWRTPGRGRTRGNPPPSPSPRSDPMWDRDLDG